MSCRLDWHSDMNVPTKCCVITAHLPSDVLVLNKSGPRLLQQTWAKKAVVQQKLEKEKNPPRSYIHRIAYRQAREKENFLVPWKCDWPLSSLLRDMHISRNPVPYPRPVFATAFSCCLVCPLPPSKPRILRSGIQLRLLELIMFWVIIVPPCEHSCTHSHVASRVGPLLWLAEMLS